MGFLICKPQLGQTALEGQLRMNDLGPEWAEFG